MKDGPSYAYLPADRVRKACVLLLREIKEGRASLAKDLLRGHKGAFRVFHTPKCLPEEQKKIIELHMGAEERRAIEFCELSHAAMDQDITFRVYISTEDFKLIRNYYPLTEELPVWQKFLKYW